MPPQPADSLKNRSFIGLILAQFLAGFNDQFIHAAAMFYAIRIEILNEAQAISLMPILFYAPWAIFVTIAGYLADRFSKRWQLVIWKFAEIGIALIALAGFLLGTGLGMPSGAWVVMATVFLMGTHAAFFAPAKYGAMPEILQPHVLSKGNGVLESTTFLAAIFGTVSGGLLSYVFHGREYWIGVVLLVLACIGAAVSLLIRYLPPANPTRAFPANPFKPLWENLKTLFHSRPLALAVLGIAFFIFMVTYMRATMYMHGETRNPKWNEFRTSWVVATVALGVGLGSPLAGFLSGGKIELGLVPLGCLGMIAGTLFAGFAIDTTAALILGLVIIGFFSGFYMVPLYTLLQHRAPKERKGDLLATSNFINVTGAMVASLLFFAAVQFARAIGATPEVPQQDIVDLIRGPARGKLVVLEKDPKTGHPTRVEIVTAAGDRIRFMPIPKLPTESEEQFLDTLFDVLDERPELLETIDADENFFETGGVRKGDEVIVSKYELRGVTHYRIRNAARPMQAAYDNEALPRYLFLGAALMTLVILLLLVRKLPDFFVRMLFWARCLGRYRIKVVGMDNLPTNGPVVLATNCDDLDSSLQVVSATDRYTHFILLENPERRNGTPLLRYVVARTGFTLVPAGREEPSLWKTAFARANDALAKNDLLAVTMDGPTINGEDRFLDQLPWRAAPVIPVFCGALVEDGRIRVVFGKPVRADADLEEIRRAIRELGEWIRQSEASGTPLVPSAAH